MKLKELDRIIKSLMKIKHYRESEVVIKESITALGPSAVVKIEQINPGFDWDGGRIIIVPESDMVKKDISNDN